MSDAALPLRAPAGAPPLCVDLHSHTLLSDGKLSPRDLVAAAAEAGVQVLAVTDHDNMEAYPEAAAEAAARGLHLIPGMEVSARYERKNLHVLAYFPPGQPPELSAWQEARRQARLRRLDRILVRLTELGLPLTREQVIPADADPRRTAGRPHVARAMVAAGHVKSYREAFDRYLGRDKPACVEDEVPSAAEAIALIHRLGGLAVVAHPALDGLGTVLSELANLGLDGVEAFHSCHEPRTARKLHGRARDMGLLVTGGSDYHGGPPAQEPAEYKRLGQVGLPAEEYERFAVALTRQQEPGT